MKNYIRKTKHAAVHDSIELLTLKEKIILQLIAEGNSTKEMASRLSLSVNTIRNHRTNIMKKLDVHDTAGLTRYAVKKGLI